MRLRIAAAKSQGRSATSRMAAPTFSVTAPIARLATPPVATLRRKRASLLRPKSNRCRAFQRVTYGAGKTKLARILCSALANMALAFAGDSTIEEEYPSASRRHAARISGEKHEPYFSANRRDM